MQTPWSYGESHALCTGFFSSAALLHVARICFVHSSHQAKPLSPPWSGLLHPPHLYSFLFFVNMHADPAATFCIRSIVLFSQLSLFT